MLREGVIFDTDSYKAGHFLQYPPGTQKIVGYLEARVGADYPYTVFAGLQYICKEYLTGSVVTEADVLEANDFFSRHGEPFPFHGWMKIVDRHGGKLPLRIRAVKEGAVVPINNVLMTVESLDDELFWLPGWFETQLMRLFHPITVATRSFASKKIIKSYLDETADDTNAEINFKLHDFGSRGVSSAESAGIGGMAHLFNFMGSDTVKGVRFANHYYGCASKMAGYSIPAMEHSTVTTWGRDFERAAFENMIVQNKGHNLVACVSDSYDFYGAVQNIWCDPTMIEFVQKHGKCVVIRPDSGEPTEVNTNALRIAEGKIGLVSNTKGYKVLPPYYRLLQGDGNDSEKDIEAVLHALKEKKYSASNIAFGMGGGLLQKFNRDTQRFAFKASEITINNRKHDVYKCPNGDLTKASKRGYLDLVKLDNVYYTVKVAESMPHPSSELVTVLENGKLMVDYNLDEIRERINTAL